jgi:hypothetical protein
LSDHFSYTVAGNYWPNHEWLSQLLFYAGYRAGGLRLLTALTASIIVGAWFLIWRLTPGGYPRKHLVCALAVIPSSMAWALRPQVFTLFFVAATALLVARRRYLLLPILFLLWANLHGGVMLGFVILASGVLALLVENRRWPLAARGESRALPAGRLAVLGATPDFHHGLLVPLLVTIGCVSATLMTPLGVSIWTEIPASLARLRVYGVSEWRPPSFTDPALLPFWLLAVCFIVLSIRQKPWKATAVASDATFWGALAMLPLAVSSGRNVPVFLLVAVPAIAGMQRAGKTPRVLPRIERPIINAGMLVAAVVVAVSSVTYAWASEVPRLGWHPLSKEAIVSLTSCPERLYNRYDEGGYVIWFVPGRKVFIDSRQDPFPLTLVNEQIRLERSGDYRRLFDQYGIRCVLTPSSSVLSERLLASGWEEAYRGSAFAVLTLRPRLD